MTLNLPITCKDCCDVFYSFLDYGLHLIRHMNTSAHVYKHRCELCNMRFKYKSYAKRHVRKHQASFVCDLCGGEYFSETSLKKHVARDHFESKLEFPCCFCPKSFRSHYSLKYHMAVHVGDAPSWCRVLSVFVPSSQLATLQTHMPQHVQGDHVCHVCGKTFATFNSLKQHAAQHGEKRFQCEHPGCQFRATYKGNLRIHMKTHLDRQENPDKFHLCDLCGKSFTTRLSLEQHRLIHSGEKPYMCSICGKAFNNRGYLWFHKKIHERRGPDWVIPKERPSRMLDSHLPAPSYNY